MDIMDVQKPEDRPEKPANSWRKRLVRDMSGQLKHVDDEPDIGDVWEQQKRIQLKEAMEEEKKRHVRNTLRKKNGLIGLAKNDLRNAKRKLQKELLGEESLKKEAAQQQKKDSLGPHPKTVEINLSLPHINYAKFRVVPRSAAYFIGTKQGRLALVCVAVALAGLGLWTISGGLSSGRAGGKTAGQSSGGDVHQTARLHKGTPKFATILPAGKTIDQLGGWTRVSPDRAAPVYAFVDTVEGVSITVSEQELPTSLVSQDAVQKLAEGFGATQELMADNITIYLGTSAKGPQSLIFVKHNLLVLIKSATIVPNDAWTTYVTALQ